MVYGVKRSLDPAAVGRENIVLAPVYGFSSTFATAAVLRAEMAELKLQIQAEVGTNGEDVLRGR